jgi:hypothetical protein
VANHLSRMNCGQDDKEPIEDKMRDDHLYRILDKDTWMIDFIGAFKNSHGFEHILVCVQVGRGHVMS